MSPSSVLLPLEQPHLQVAALVGAAATGVVVALQWRQPRLRTAGTGWILTVVAAAELVTTRNAPRSLVVVLACLAAGGAVRAVAGRGHRPPWWAASLLPVAMVAGGSAWLAFGPGMNVPGPLWVRLAVLLGTLVTTTALWSFDRRWARLTLPLLVVTTAGIYTCTPDTEQILIVAGAAIGVTAVGWWWGRGLGSVAAPAVAGLVTWTVAVDGRGRHGSIVGGLGCLGLLLAAPVAVRWAGRGDSLRGVRPWPMAVGAIALQCVVVAVSARVGGLRRSTSAAAAIVVPLLAVATAVLAAMVRSTGRGGGSPPPPGPPADRAGWRS